MIVFEIRKNVSLKEIEEYFDLLSKWKKPSGFIDLKLPSKLENNYCGLMVSLIQLCVTWARYPKSRNLILPVKSPEKHDWHELYKNELIFPIVALVWNNHEIHDLNGKSIRSYLIGPNSKVFERMLKIDQLDQPLRGSKLLLTEFDHLPEEKGILPCFEVNGKFIGNHTLLQNNLKPGIERVLSFSNELKINFEEIRVDSIQIVFELMKNTWEWAREDSNNVALDPNIRGALIRFFTKKRRILIDDFKDHPGLKEYFQSDVLKENNQGNIYFLEISVFDSGVGFVNQYKSAITDAEEMGHVQILKECLIKHNTTDKSLGKGEKGIGLDLILSTLDGRGFLRIKTGDVCVYRNMISDRYKLIEKNDSSKMKLFDWITNNDIEYKSHADAEGSVITIIYPLSINLPS